MKFGVVFVISSSDFQTSSTLLIFFVLDHELLMYLRNYLQVLIIIILQESGSLNK